MKKISMFFAVMAIMMGVTTRILAQVTDTKANDANAQILGAITLTAAQDLEFGGIVPNSTSASTVVINSADARSIGSGTPTLVTSKVTPKSGAYTVTGTGLVGYIITIPTADFNITNTTGIVHETMAVSEMTCSKGASSTFASDGTDAFKVGGTLHIAANQAAGLYTGTFNVTVAY